MDKNIKIEISYKGTRYHGFQRQKDRLSIQEVLEDALSKNLREDIQIEGSGRTDKGVHALRQVANFKTGTHIPTPKIPRLVNYDLPDDITIMDAIEVDYDFHSRFLAKSRTYCYNIYQAQNPSGLLNDISWHIYQNIDIKKMEEGADLLIGTKDFLGFSQGSDEKKSTIRCIYSIDIVKTDNFIKIRITASSFLRSMARIIVGSLVGLGTGDLELGDFRLGLETKDRTKLGPTAPAKGLVLEEVSYD